MSNASKIPCSILYRPSDPIYREEIRRFQGCPTLAITPGGRIYLGWYSGGVREPHMENYNLLIYSDDQGETWSDPLLIIPSSIANRIHALDIQLWTDPSGRLHIWWVQNNTSPASEILPPHRPGQPQAVSDGWLFNDFLHAAWEIVCENPDDDDPIFSEPRYVDHGFLRCKPLFMDNGSWLLFNYDQTDTRYGYSLSEDKGKSYVHRYGSEKLSTFFDEGMAYQLADGSIRMFARSNLGELAQCISRDRGLTWSQAELSGIPSADTRFFVARTPSGRILLVNNNDRKIRRNMTISLSEDDGATWKYQKCIDTRPDISYPDVDFYDGRIYLAYDRERTGAKEILFLSFTEGDVMDESISLIPRIVSKP